MLIAPLLTVRNSTSSLFNWGALVLLASTFSVALAYFGLHYVFSMLVDLPIHAGAKPVAYGLIIFTLVCFALLFLVQSLIRANPAGKVARRLYPWFYNGLYLDPLFTRITFQVWPVKAPAADKNEAGNIKNNPPSGVTQ